MEYQHVELFFDYFNKHSTDDYEQYKDNINDALSQSEDYYQRYLGHDPKVNKKTYQKAFEAALFHENLPHDVYSLAVKSFLNLIDNFN
jgi:hypothetical protein